MKTIAVIFAVLLGTASVASAGTWCKNGTYSQSEGSGTCSHHGGEQ